MNPREIKTKQTQNCGPSQVRPQPRLTRHHLAPCSECAQTFLPQMSESGRDVHRRSRMPGARIRRLRRILRQPWRLCLFVLKRRGRAREAQRELTRKVVFSLCQRIWGLALRAVDSPILRDPQKTHRTNFSRFHPPSTQAGWRDQVHPFFNVPPEGPLEFVVRRVPPTRGPRSIHESLIDGSPWGPVEFGISWRSPTGGSRCDKSYRPPRKPI